MDGHNISELYSVHKGKGTLIPVLN